MTNSCVKLCPRSLAALSNQAMLLGARSSEQLIIGGGISAMPSVHNALAVLFALAAFQLNRTLGWILAAYAAGIWIGSIHLGWHYGADGIVAAVLTFSMWRVSGWIADKIDQPEAQVVPIHGQLQPN